MTTPPDVEEFNNFKAQVHEDFRDLENKIDEVARTKYTPFFATAAVFMAIGVALWSGNKDIETKVDMLQVRVSVAVNKRESLSDDLQDKYSRHLIIHEDLLEQMRSLRKHSDADHK